MLWVSPIFRGALKHFSTMYGMKKGYLIENAINHYLEAMYKIPEEFIIPSTISVTQVSFEKIVEMTETPPKPTDALVELMHED